MDEKRLLFLANVTDLVSSLLYYDRKEDEELTRDDVEVLLESGRITIKEIVEMFEKTLTQKCEENFVMPPDRKEEEEADVTGP
jgi:hypothetical protein